MLRASLRIMAPAGSKKLIGIENRCSAHNYHPLPVVFSKAKGVNVWDPEGRKYLDFMSGYGSVNQGHLHPKIVGAAKEQLGKVTLSCRAFYNDQYPVFAQKITKLLGYDKVLPMNTGAEAVETAVKLAKKWAYRVKGVKPGEAKIVCMSGNFHGRTHLCISLSDDPDSYSGYEPLLPGIIRSPYGSIDLLRQTLDEHGSNVAAVILEPVQGEAGVVFPPDGFLRALREETKKRNILLISDEIQSGLGRTGYMMAIEHEGVRPDIAIFAKALGGGIVPVSCALADNEIMDVITPGTHGSTFGGNPMAARVAIAALDVIVDEKLCKRSRELGLVLDAELAKLKQKYDGLILDTRCRGLWAAVVFSTSGFTRSVMHRCYKHGVLIKSTHETTLRLAPPLVITKEQLLDGVRRLDAAVDETCKSGDLEVE